MAELDERKQQVLKAVVDDFTSTAVPVGSQTLALRYFARWSSATIRNELAQLVDSGHLEQPHTSSGRIPSDIGYRYFVDYLMHEEPVDPALRTKLVALFEALPPDLETILETTAMALARSVENVGVVTAPRTSQCRLKHVDLVHLEGKRILALVVLEGNLVRQLQLQLEAEVSQAQLAGLATRLNSEAKSATHKELRAATGELPAADWEIQALRAIADFMQAVDSQSATVVVHDGVRNLVKQPEFLDSGRLLPVLELLEQSRELARVMEGMDLRDIEVFIGDENADEHLRDCSLVMSAYAAAGTRGTLGTIGPTRMRYPQVVSRLRLITRLAGETISRLYD